MRQSCVCDKCKVEFEVHGFLCRRETLKNDYVLDITFFACPQCGQEYIVQAEDTTAKNLRKELYASQQRYTSYCAQEKIDPEQERRLRKDISAHKRRYQRYVLKLRKKYVRGKRRGNS